MVGKIKGEKFQPLSFTQSDYILSTAIHEVNNIPILKNDRYVFLMPSQVVNPTLEVLISDIDDNVPLKKLLLFFS